MMEVFEIMRATGASLYIEKLNDGRGFTKRVSVRFDGSGEYLPINYNMEDRIDISIKL